MSTKPIRLGDDEIVALSVSPAEAATMLSVSRGTIYNLLNSGELRRVRIGRACRIRVSDLVDLLDRNAE
jgi:excisionase family DNA binding protein